ncbi:hypothetical protein FZ025_09990 [Xanthomonas hyacinthi]|nr:hypothetical protein FZ025_09990 [Xanthomonas hyacinthi]
MFISMAPVVGNGLIAGATQLPESKCLAAGGRTASLAGRIAPKPKHQNWNRVFANPLRMRRRWRRARCRSASLDQRSSRRSTAIERAQPHALRAYMAQRFRLPDRTRALLENALNEQGATSRRRTGTFMEVHPGLLGAGLAWSPPSSRRSCRDVPRSAPATLRPDRRADPDLRVADPGAARTRRHRRQALAGAGDGAGLGRGRVRQCARPAGVRGRAGAAAPAY